MSSRNAATADAVVPFAPKLSGRPEIGDPLEKAGHLILEMVGKAANAAEANYQQTVETSRKLSGQLRGAEERISSDAIDARPGHCQIVRRQSESSDGEFHYVIRSTHEDHERVAREGELTRA